MRHTERSRSSSPHYLLDGVICPSQQVRIAPAAGHEILRHRGAAAAASSRYSWEDLREEVVEYTHAPIEGHSTRESRLYGSSILKSSGCACARETAKRDAAPPLAQIIAVEAVGQICERNAARRVGPRALTTEAGMAERLR
jgi:hypothetical protein